MEYPDGDLADRHLARKSPGIVLLRTQAIGRD
jgi:hypothetical protein